MLPSSGNELGDTWIVGETPWVCGSGLPAQLRPFENRFATFSGKVYPFSFISTEGPTNQKPKHRQDLEGCRHPFAVPVDSLPCGSFAGALPRFVMLRIEYENAANFLNGLRVLMRAMT